MFLQYHSVESVKFPRQWVILLCDNSWRPLVWLHALDCVIGVRGGVFILLINSTYCPFKVLYHQQIKVFNYWVHEGGDERADILLTRSAQTRGLQLLSAPYIHTVCVYTFASLMGPSWPSRCSSWCCSSSWLFSGGSGLSVAPWWVLQSPNAIITCTLAAFQIDVGVFLSNDRWLYWNAVLLLVDKWKDKYLFQVRLV